MRGERERQANIMLAVTPEAFVPENHPLRRIKPLVDDCLARLSPRFDEMYASRGRPSIPPEHLLKGSLLELTAAAYNLVRLSRLEPVLL